MTEITRDLKNPHNIYKTEDGRFIRLINDRVVVKLDPDVEVSHGGIIIPDAVGDRGDMGIYTTGTIKAVGFIETRDDDGNVTGKIPIPDLTVGEKVLLIRYYGEQHSNKQIQSRIEEGLIVVKWYDLLFAFPKSEEKRVRWA